ncbi:hypothetical protein C8F01DRAFT_1285057 [Mycena amicta]|nr:hypothetical protein C8F01DRAFT_1285057 [Mycena amicta]
MAPFTSIFLSLCLVASAVAAPMHAKRQIGDLDCNLARLTIIHDVTTAKDLISQMQNANSTASDLPTSAAFAVAQTGLSSVQAAIQQILDAVLVNDPAPAATRLEVVGGLGAASTALQSASQTMKECVLVASLNSTMSAVLAVLKQAAPDAKNVITTCSPPATK